MEEIQVADEWFCLEDKTHSSRSLLPQLVLNKDDSKRADDAEMTSQGSRDG
jgi:hypothetical protein